MSKFKSKTSSLPKSRKQIRKEKRMNKKLKRSVRSKQEFTVASHDEFDKGTKVFPSKNKNSIGGKPKTVSDCCTDEQAKQRQKDEKQFRKLQSQMKTQRKRQLLKANEKEDQVIRSLEKKLKLNRRKSQSLPQSFVSEGLDYLLDVCNYDKFKNSINLEKELNEAGDEFEDDFALVTGSKKKENEKKKSSSTQSVEEETGEDNDYEEESESDDSNMEDGNDLENFSDNSEDDPTGEIHTDEEEEVQSEAENHETPIIEKKCKEDIYGRLRDDKGNIIEENQKKKYIPPYLRAQSSNEINEDVMKLTKLMKGFLNRLTERNMHNIASQIEDQYSQYSRHDVNSVLLKLLSESLITSVLSPERIVIEHAMLISVLHANVGSEIGANILQNMVDEFIKLFEENLPVEDKRIDNVVIFLCQLYNFKVFHACLMYDILKKCIDKFEEKHIELVLIILKNIGFNLRKDDPVALKELIFNVQNKANESSNLRENNRVRFMLDTLTAVKNNNMLKVQSYDPSYADHLKKIQKSLLRSGKYVTELKILLEDLMDADTKGRWWIVGSAWSGDRNLKGDQKANISSKSTQSFDQKLLDLAKKQSMNTDARRNIFCILMTSETYMDACEELIKLDLKGQQYREILHVLLHCLMKEKQYNPFYAFVAEHFCSIDRKYQLAIQFSVWDKLKEIDSLKPKQMTNLARFLSYMFLEKKLPLSVLKVLQFTEMNKRMVRLVRQIMLAVLLSDDESVIVEVFSRISKSEKLFMLREGLQLFLDHFILKNVETLKDSACEQKIHLLPERVELAVNAMRAPSSDF